MTTETRAKIAASMIGHSHPQSLEVRAKISASHMGLKTSPETRVKHSVVMMGNTLRLGHKASSETRAKQSMANWRGGSTVWRRKSEAKRRTLGFNLLNSPFPGCEGHHINKDDVIHIPALLHQSVKHCLSTGRNMEKVNTLAGQYLAVDWT